MSIKKEFFDLDVKSLNRLKTRLKRDMRNENNHEDSESLKDYINQINEAIMIKEDGDGGGGGDAGGTGVAMATQGNVSGMGNVSSSQPSGVPGAAATGDGTVGSGDISMPLGKYTKKGVTGNQYTKFDHKPGKSKKKGKKKNKKILSDVADFLQKHKKNSKQSNTPKTSKTKVMDYQDFVKDNVNKIK
jgi:hypothetical protein